MAAEDISPTYFIANLLIRESFSSFFRGRAAYNHEGNCRFRKILAGHLEKYKVLTTKQQKSLMVVSILDEVQAKSRFVRSDADGNWFQVQEHVAKEKVRAKS